MWNSWLIGPWSAVRGDDSREGEQDWHAGRDQCTEREDQDDQRDRDREDLGALKVIAALVVDGVGRGDIACLLDRDRGVNRLRGEDRLANGQSAHVAQGDHDERRVPVRETSRAPREQVGSARPRRGRRGGQCRWIAARNAGSEARSRLLWR